jgi:hypothetical protein
MNRDQGVPSQPLSVAHTGLLLGTPRSLKWPNRNGKKHALKPGVGYPAPPNPYEQGWQHRGNLPVPDPCEGLALWAPHPGKPKLRTDSAVTLDLSRAESAEKRL